MRKIFQPLLLSLLLLFTTAEAHVVSQFYGEKIGQGLEILFDVSYAVPEERDDENKPPLLRSWLIAQDAESHAALRAETERYLRQCLTFQSNGAEIAWKVEFPDFEKNPPEFFQLLNDFAYYRVRVMPVENTQPIALKWLPGKRPNLVVKLAQESYLTLKPGDVWVADSTEESAGAHSTWLVALQQGFLHVLPLGLDHMLFLAGMFFVVAARKNLLMQSLSFTCAHTITLGLCSAGVIVVSPSWVEPLIAASIAFLAIENLVRKESPKQSRMIVIFLFGLVHGCGFAQVLSTWVSDSGNFALALFCANVGVEMAQLTVLVALWLITLPLKKLRQYHRIEIAANCAIVLMGLLWTCERIVSN